MLKARSKYPIGFLVCSGNLVTVCLLWFKNGANFIQGAHAEVVNHMVFAKPIEPASITGVNLLSPGGQGMFPGYTVVVDGEGILVVTGDSSIPASAEVINGHGKYIVPDFIDSHVPLKSPNDLLLYLATGGTSISDSGGRQCSAFTTPFVEMA